MYTPRAVKQLLLAGKSVELQLRLIDVTCFVYRQCLVRIIRFIWCYSQSSAPTVAGARKGQTLEAHTIQRVPSERLVLSL